MKIKNKATMITPSKRRPIIMLTATQIAQIVSLASQGIPFKRIERMTGISRNTIKKYARLANQPVSPRLKTRNILEDLTPVIEEKFFPRRETAQ